MYIYDILMNMITSISNLFYNHANTHQLTDHQQKRISELNEEINELIKTHNIDINKIYKDLYKVNKKINRKTDYVIILKYLERETKEYELFKSLETEKEAITIESIERQTTLLDLKSKMSILLQIKEKKEKINRIMNVN